jgi:hypothetical protein
MAAILVLLSTAWYAHDRHLHQLPAREAPGVAGRLYDHLARSFSRRDLFIDVDAMSRTSISSSSSIPKQLDTQVSQCDVLLALIEAVPGHTQVKHRRQFALRCCWAPRPQLDRSPDGAPGLRYNPRRDGGLRPDL